MEMHVSYTYSEERLIKTSMIVISQPADSSSWSRVARAFLSRKLGAPGESSLDRTPALPPQGALALTPAPTLGPGQLDTRGSPNTHTPGMWGNRSSQRKPTQMWGAHDNSHRQWAWSGDNFSFARQTYNERTVNKDLLQLSAQLWRRLVFHLPLYSPCCFRPLLGGGRSREVGEGNAAVAHTRASVCASYLSTPILNM